MGPVAADKQTNCPRDADIVLVGDLMLGDSPICPGFGFAHTFGGAHDGNPFGEVASLLEGEVVVGNLETPLSRTGLQSDDWRSVQMRGLPRHAHDLAAAGFNVITVANNHALQHGETAFWESVEGLRRAGIEVAGLRGPGKWHTNPVIHALPAGQSVGVLGYNLRPEQYGVGPLPYASGPERWIRRDTERLAGNVDSVVVTLHWGDEFVGRPSRAQTSFAHSLADAGATVVAGHHPHVVQPIERYQNSILAYSLGNFVTDMIWEERLREGAVLRCCVNGPQVESISVSFTRMTDDFRLLPEAATDESAVIARSGVGLSESSYRRLVRRGLRSQRLAAYRYALSNLPRYRSDMLFQLGLATLRNKLGLSES